MPPPRIPDPQFSPTGRYLLNVAERREPGDTFFHDTFNFTDECGIQDMNTNSISRFNNAGWALRRGFKRCEHCFTTNINSERIISDN